MISKKVPIYFYQSGTQYGTGFFYILMDTEIVERYIDMAYNTKLQDWSGIAWTNLKEVNDYLGVPLINQSMNFYTKFITGTDSITDYFITAFNTLGLYRQNVTVPASNNVTFRTVNGSVYQDVMPGILLSGEMIPLKVEGGAPLCVANYDNRDRSFNITISVIREDAFNSDGVIVKNDRIDFYISGHLSADCNTITDCKLYVRPSQSGVGSWSPTFNLKDAQAQDSDINNPFPDDPDDGGDGDNRPPEVDPTGIPELPDVSATDSGLITIYTPTLAQLQALGNFLWAGMFDPDSFKKLFSDPMQAIIGLAIVPKIPATAGSKNIKFGNVDSGVNAPYLSTQYVQFDCGSVAIKKQVGSFLDYTDTRIQIFLPYIGFREIAATDVMGASIQVVYNIDVLTGSCAAFIKHSSRGVIYAYNGSCITNVALTAANFSGAIQNAVTTVASGVGVLAGMASGAAPVTLASATSMLSSAANTVMNAKPQIQRSGNLGGSAGMLSAKKPFIIIERPNYSVPDFFTRYEGRVSNKTANLGSVSGFTMVEAVHLDGITATTGEILEMEALLKAGVIL